MVQEHVFSTFREALKSLQPEGEESDEGRVETGVRSGTRSPGEQVEGWLK